jgi:hypothetical protein
MDMRKIDVIHEPGPHEYGVLPAQPQRSVNKINYVISVTKKMLPYTMSTTGFNNRRYEYQQHAIGFPRKSLKIFTMFTF